MIQLKGAINILLIVVIATASLLFLFNSLTTTHKKEAVVTAMLESGKIAIIESQDHSSRIKEYISVITENEFEKAFEKAINNNLNINVAIKDITYRYLQSDDDVKAIDIQLTTEDGDIYKAIFRQNISEEE